jgi:hypothetical protein
LGVEFLSSLRYRDFFEPLFRIVELEFVASVLKGSQRFGGAARPVADFDRIKVLGHLASPFPINFRPPRPPLAKTAKKSARERELAVLAVLERTSKNQNLDIARAREAPEDRQLSLPGGLGLIGA